MNRKYTFSRALFTPISLLLAACIILLIAIGSATLARADGPHRAGLVIAHDGEVLKRCVEFSEDEISGLDLLRLADVDLNYAQTGQGVTVCRIDRQGCSYPEQDCFCQCQGSPCIYWSAWSLAGDGWEYSTVGASGMRVRDGKVIGWNWAAGSTSSAKPPPSASFEEICGPATTDTPTLSPSAQPSLGIGTETPPPTETRRPTATPKPPAIAYFAADRSAINAGESVLLSWDLSGAEAAYLRYDGTEEGVVAPGSKSIAPETTTEYTLVARGEGGEVKTRLTVTVNPAVSTATLAPTDGPPPSPTLTSAPTLPTATPGPSPAAPAAALVPPTDTPAPPAATLQPSPAETSPAATSTRAISTATPTPVALAAVPGAQKPATPVALRVDRSAPKTSGATWFLAVVGVAALGGALLLGVVGIIAWRGRRRY
jgi:hypothetical protein